MVHWLYHYVALSACRLLWILPVEPLTWISRPFFVVDTICSFIQELDHATTQHGATRNLRAVDLTVNLTYSSYIGTAQSKHVNQWLGIRYAAPPLGDLRFAPPEDPLADGRVHKADKHGALCLATGDSPSNSQTSEDCLFLDVYAPSTATPHNSSLPVFLFIQGGGFSSDANPNLNGAGLIDASDHSIIVVTFNYRVGPYGFITGPGITANNGLRDQRKVMEWIQRHISAFGGDPDKVVLGGASAGAASIALHLIANGGKDMHLFAAAASESQSFATVLTVEESLYQTENFAKALNCGSPTSNSPQSKGHDYLSCLRSKTANELQIANHNIRYPQSKNSLGTNGPPLYMWNPAIDNDMLTDITYEAFKSGAFVKVPVIFGDDTNGGTIFTPRDTATLEESDQFLVNQFPFLTDNDIATLNTLYPNTDSKMNCTGTRGCFWHQVSRAYGELRYMCPGLFLSSVFSDANMPSWNYRWDVQDAAQMASGLGVPHTAELNAIFGPENVPGNSAPSSYRRDGVNAYAVEVAQGYWTSFIRTVGRDVNTYRSPRSARWEVYGNGDGDKKGIGGQRLVVGTGGTTQMESTSTTDHDSDTGLAECCAWLVSRGTVWRQRQI